MTRTQIMVAPTGARRGEADHPALPMTQDEIVVEAVRCAAAGADALHLHVREDDGAHSLDAGRYREALAALAEAAPTLALQITTEAAGKYDVAAQYACLRAVRPAWASIGVREIARAPELADAVYGFCAEAGVRVQHILFDDRDAAQLARWRESGAVRAAQDEVILVLGAYAPPRAGAPDEIDARIAALAEGARWAACAFGARELDCLSAAAQAGAAILRVGCENNVHHPSGRLWRDNAEAVSTLIASLDASGD